jgi:stage III sporulation protein SpoIIIAA
MSISQNIYDYIELSKITKQPILLISNPGYGKTTSLTNWAKEKGYH